MQPDLLPSPSRMYEAVTKRDRSFEGIFVVGVTTTGIFCRPGCPARTPLRKNLEFFPTPRAALGAGYRPCKRCRPMEPAGTTPEWIEGLLREVDRDPLQRWSEQDLRDRGIDPNRVRRWFKECHGMTFLAYLRARRLGHAFGALGSGGALARTALDSGYESLSGFCEAVRRITGEPPRRSAQRARLLIDRIPTPLGPMLAAASDEALYLLEFHDRRMLETQFKILTRRIGATFFPGSNAVLKAAHQGIAHYFGEGAGSVPDLPWQAPGSDFQTKVWNALAGIPRGQTRTYAEIAQQVGSAPRAVGRAVGENRLAILVPCHRVVGADGMLTGYGGGLWRKRKLLALENRARG